MKKFYLFTAALAALTITGCNKSVNPDPGPQPDPQDGKIVTVTATIASKIEDEGKTPWSTKSVITDKYSEEEEMVDMTAEWVAGDTFKALAINEDVPTLVEFKTEGNGKTAEFKSTSKVKVNESTVWVAVTGNVEYNAEKGEFACNYDNQNGSLNNLDKYLYRVAKAEGEQPAFDFSKGTALTYVMRVLLPAGVKTIEFNTGETYNGGCVVTSGGKTKTTTSTPVKAAVKTLTLASTSTAGTIAYLAIPAIDYSVGEGETKNRVGGLIVTVMSADKRESQGKVWCSSALASAGCVGTFDMSKLELMPRPLASEAIDLGSVTVEGTTYQLGAWAPFNLGGDEPTSDANIKGAMFAWGEYEPKTSFTKDGYAYYSGGTYNTQIGNKLTTVSEGVDPFIEYDPAGGVAFKPGAYYDIKGTRYDAARVKWGSEWCMPSNDIANNICLTGEYFLNPAKADGKVVKQFYAAGTYKNSLGYTAGLGAWVIQANGKELALYSNPYTDTGSKTDNDSNARYWISTSDYGVFDAGTFKGYWNRSTQMRMSSSELYVNNKSYQWDGLAIRPVLNK